MSVAVAARTEIDCSRLAGKYLTFNLASEIYGLEILKVQEIISLMKITKVPRTPAFVTGVINLRGKVIPVINMRLKFGLELVPDTERTCIIVIQVTNAGAQTVTLGIIVDEVSEVLNLAASQISQTPVIGASVNTDYIKGMGKIENNVIMLLDMDKAFSSDEIRSMASAGA